MILPGRQDALFSLAQCDAEVGKLITLQSCCHYQLAAAKHLAIDFRHQTLNQ